MAASKRFMNWTGVTFTPVTGTAVTYTGVESVAIEPGGSLQKFSGDGDRYNTTVVNDHNEPSLTINCADATAVQACPIGTVGTVTATFNDARNGAGLGAITFTLANAVVESYSVNGAHRQFGKGMVKFTSFSTDGVTNPLTTSIGTGS